MKKSFWEGKNIVITGSSSGIGLAVLNRLSELNCKIFAVSLDNVVYPTKNAGITPLQCNIGIEEEVTNTTKKILTQTDQIDVLFNNAGITAHGRFDETDMNVFKKTFQINFFGAVQIARELIHAIKKAKGTIITTSTVSGLYGIPGRAVYSSSKSALHAVFESIRIELSEHGVRSIIFCPPYTKTNLRTSGLDAKGNQLNEAQFKGHLKTPEEVADLMIDAVENKSSRLVIIDKSGFFVKWMRNFWPSMLEKILFKKLYKDFHGDNHG